MVTEDVRVQALCCASCQRTLERLGLMWGISFQSDLICCILQGSSAAY